MLRMGFGLRAKKKFEKGDPVIEYRGDLLTNECEAPDSVYVLKFQLPNGKYNWFVFYCYQVRFGEEIDIRSRHSADVQ